MKKFNLNDFHHHDEKFHLLSKLINAGGEPNSVNALKMDILNKFNKGYSSVVDFLFESDYIDLLTSDDIKLILEHPGVDILAIKWMEKEMSQLESPLFWEAKSVGNKIIWELFLDEFEEDEELFDEFGGIILEKFPYRSVFISKYYNDILWMDFEDEWYDNPILFTPKKNEIKELAIWNLGEDPCLIKYILRGCFQSLETLYLNCYSINPSIIFEKLKSIRKLLISGGDSSECPPLNLTELPDSIRNLKSLRELEISFTNLCSIPESIGNLSSLEYLSLRNTEIGTLPDSIGNLKSLRELNILHTKIKKLPKSIKKKKDLLIKL